MLFLGQTKDGRRAFAERGRIRVGDGPWSRKLGKSDYELWFYEKSHPLVVSVNYHEGLVDVQTGEMLATDGKILDVVGSYALVEKDDNKSIVNVNTGDVIFSSKNQSLTSINIGERLEHFMYVSSPEESYVLFTETGEIKKGEINDTYGWGGISLDGVIFDKTGTPLDFGLREYGGEINPYGIPAYGEKCSILPRAPRLGDDKIYVCVEDKDKVKHYYGFSEFPENLEAVPYILADMSEFPDGTVRIGEIYVSEEGVGLYKGDTKLFAWENPEYMVINYSHPHLLINRRKTAVIVDVEKHKTKTIPLFPGTALIIKDRFLLNSSPLENKVTDLDNGETWIFSKQSCPSTVSFLGHGVFFANGKPYFPRDKNSTRPLEP